MKLFDRVVQPSLEMKPSVTAVERIVRYDFKNKRLLEEALTHPSITYKFHSYERLALLGDAALGLAISNHLFRTCPDSNQGDLSSLRVANVSTEKFARVAVRLGLYRHLRHNSPALDDQVTKFTEAVKEEGPEAETLHVYGGNVKASKVLADIVESVAAAVYIDMNFDLDKLWTKFQPLLKPIVTLEKLQGHPVTMLFKLCQSHGKKVNIEQRRDETANMSTASVYVDGEFVAPDSSKHKDIAKLNAARIALEKLSKSMGDDLSFKVIAGNQAKQKLNGLCVERKLPKPSYEIEKESGPPHAKKYVSKVKIETLDGDQRCITGYEKSKLRDAEDSAASLMIFALRESDHVINTKESDWLMGYVPSVDSLWAMMRLSVFCLKRISLSLINFVLVLSVIGCIQACYYHFGYKNPYADRPVLHTQARENCGNCPLPHSRCVVGPHCIYVGPKA